MLAVSGGVDSMVLLHLLMQKDQSLVDSRQSLAKEQKTTKTNDSRLSTSDSIGSIELIVAHFNHGIRPDANEDEKLVMSVAKEHDLPVEVGRGKLGVGASEATARTARYKFLENVRQKTGSDLIITAHHQDDMIETAVLNMLRGTGRRGISAISSNKAALRPLLAHPKVEIIDYAQKNGVKWREDSTNKDETYLRNYIRSNITSRLTNNGREQFLENADNVAKSNIKIDKIIATLSRLVIQDNKINRYKFSLLPNEIGNELIMIWLRSLGIREFNKKNVEKISMALKTAKSGTKQPIIGGLDLVIEERFAILG